MRTLSVPFRKGDNLFRVTFRRFQRVVCRLDGATILTIQIRPFHVRSSHRKDPAKVDANTRNGTLLRQDDVAPPAPVLLQQSDLADARPALDAPPHLLY